MSGELTEGQAFPSVRTLAADLKIHPNTAHKAVQYLIHERWLEMKPGIGTAVASAPRTLAEMQRQLMEHEVAVLIAEARRMGLSPDELKRAIDAGWEKTAAAVEVGR